MAYLCHSLQLKSVTETNDSINSITLVLAWLKDYKEISVAEEAAAAEEKVITLTAEEDAEIIPTPIIAVPFSVQL